MESMDLIRSALHMTDQGIAALVADLRDKPLIRPTANGGNHPLWIMGHLAYIEGSLSKILFDQPNPVEHWAPLFATGTQPSDDAGIYPPFDEVISTFHRLRAQTIQRLDEIGPAGLNAAPRHVPPGFEESMTTVGQALLLTALHQMVHYGQLADARRAAGLQPLI
jgi:hypothetical protein